MPALLIHLLVEREIEGIEWVRERERDEQSNSAEMVIDCRERECVSDYLAVGCWVVDVSGGGSGFAEPLPASGAQQSFCHVCICVWGNVPANLLCVQQRAPFKQPQPRADTNCGVTQAIPAPDVKW